MSACAPSFDGARGMPHPCGLSLRSTTQRGFTLLEMCLVLLIMVIMLGVMLPSIQTAFVEQSIRNDASQLSMVVKTGMRESTEQHRPYLLDLTATNLVLHPFAAIASSNNEEPIENGTRPDDMSLTVQIKDPNKLFGPDPQKSNAWIPMPPTSWVFEPGELCPVQSVRLCRGSAWLQLNFNALTGNVENETSYIP